MSAMRKTADQVFAADGEGADPVTCPRRRAMQTRAVGRVCGMLLGLLFAFAGLQKLVQPGILVSKVGRVDGGVGSLPLLVGFVLLAFLAWDVMRFALGDVPDCGCLGVVRLGTWPLVFTKHLVLVSMFVGYCWSGRSAGRAHESKAEEADANSPARR